MNGRRVHRSLRLSDGIALGRGGPLDNPVMIQTPHLGDLGKVVSRRRRVNHPFQARSVPGVMAGILFFPQADHQVQDESQGAGQQHQVAQGGQQVQPVPAEFAGIGINPARHPVQAQVVHREKGDVHPDEVEPEVGFADALVQQFPGQLGKPVIDPGKNAEQGPAEQHIMDMGHDVIGILLLIVRGGDGMGHPAEPAHDKEGDKPQGKEHRRFQVNGAAPKGANPVKDFHPGRHGNQHGGDGEHRHRNRPQAHGEHMVTPHRPAHYADDDAGKDHDRIAEQRLAGESGQHFGDNAHRRQNQDIDLRVTEHPEQMLPHNGIAAALRDEKVGAEVAVEGQLDQSHGDDRKSQHQQHRSHQGHPDEQGHPHQAHPRRPHIDDGNDEVKGGGQGGYAQHLQAQGPIVQAGVGAERLFGQVGVGKPAGVRGLIGQETGVEQQPAKEEHPVAERVQPGKGHIPGPDGQGDDEVKETGAQRHHHQENHGGAVHGEHLVKGVRADQGIVRHGQLQADDAGFDAAQEQKDESRRPVQNADALVVNRSKPAPEAGLAGRAGDYAGSFGGGSHCVSSPWSDLRVMPVSDFTSG